eukprot:5138877-Prymnesium_polylepis.1
MANMASTGAMAMISGGWRAATARVLWVSGVRCKRARYRARRKCLETCASGAVCVEQLRTSHSAAADSGCASVCSLLRCCTVPSGRVMFGRSCTLHSA